MNPPQLRHTDMQCGAETDRRAQPARHRHRHSQALALGRQPPAQPPGMKPPDGSVSTAGAIRCSRPARSSLGRADSGRGAE